jgi:hypothetical protein
MIGVISFSVIVILCVVGCGGGKPKTLAAEAFELSKEYIGALYNPSKAADLEKKMEEHEAKISGLSPEDYEIYQTELARLTGDVTGALFGGMLDSLTDSYFNDAESALDAAGTIFNEMSNDSFWDFKDALQDLTKELGN